MSKSNEPKPIRELMPEGYLPKIAQMTGAWPSNISEVVNSERTRSKIWPAIEQLAKETDSKAYKARIEWLSTNRSKYTGAAA